MFAVGQKEYTSLMKVLFGGNEGRSEEALAALHEDKRTTLQGEKKKDTNTHTRKREQSSLSVRVYEKQDARKAPLFVFSFFNAESSSITCG